MRAGRFSILGTILVLVLAWLIWEQHSTEEEFLHHQRIEENEIKEVIVWGELYRNKGNGVGSIERPQRRVTEQETKQIIAAFNKIRSETVTIENHQPQTKFIAGIAFYMKSDGRMINIWYRDSGETVYVSKNSNKKSIYYSINEPDIQDFFDSYISDFLKESSE
ncbi:hypothetical protein [Paenibacillus ginsengarvi]|uniref:Uncharacterized protein n=1 Tax=Paenibacillus ginsengarvi TaxID=400777 RepID=A0A3B0BE44_9BACL|nr:hypothetical protein [Paenibacillus ginsengarvi]RKN70594.1 hypothetical protein D7M11_30465 [Paenibacillus ginsengarvi]